MDYRKPERRKLAMDSPLTVDGSGSPAVDTGS
jgi:hypothetical protein